MDYTLIRSRRRSMALEIKNGKLILRVPLRTSQAQIRLFLQQHQVWIETHMAKAQHRQKELAQHPILTEQELAELTRQAKVFIPQRVAHFAPLVGVTYGTVTIRHQRSLWGSCSGRGNLSFNCLLMLAPPEVLDAIVVHELCHRKEMNHSARFYAEVLRVLPDYHACHNWLKEHSDELLTRLPDF